MNRQRLRKIADEISATGFLDYRLYLDAIYEAAKNASDDAYSYQQFADDLGFGATTVLHQVIRGHRPLTPKAGEKIVQALNLRKTERQYFLTLIEYTRAKTLEAREHSFRKLMRLKEATLPEELDRSWLEYFGEWYHPVIREMVALPDFRPDPKWIAGRIVPSIKPEQARESLELLARLELIHFDKDRNAWLQTEKRVSTGARVRGMGLLRYHQQMIGHGRESLTRIPGHRRDISSMTVMVNDDLIKKIKELIHAFQTKVLDETDKDNDGDQIYQINVQLFPFTE